MRLPGRTRDPALQDRLVWQCASLLLAYPDERHVARLDTVDEMRSHISGSAAAMLGRTAAALRSPNLLQAQADYVETFDMRRRSTMYLTYWTAGDTRNRGGQMHAFAQVYRDSGVEPPKHEAPDHLPVVLEFAATVDPVAGRRLLVDHRVAVDVLRDVLAEKRSPYADAVAAVCATLPPATDREVQRANQLSSAGPPAEAVGLQPFTLTIPPRRFTGGE